MNTDKRRIAQIKAKLSQLDKSISTNAKQNSSSLIDLLDSKSRKTQSKQTISESQRTIDKSRCIHLDLTHNRFYEEAKARNQLKQQMEDEVAKGYKRIANKKKMNDQSAQILSERLKANIAIAILNTDQELSKRFGFEQVGKILTDLGMFSVIAFNENFEGELISRKR